MTTRILFIVAAAACVQAQPLRLTLAEAQRLALQNHPRLAAAQYVAAAAAEVPKQYRAAFQPSAFASLTGVGADNGSRLAAGGLNNPVVYNRLGSGFSVSQMVTDFGRTGHLAAAARLRAEAQGEATGSARAQIVLAVSRAYVAVLRARDVLKVANQTVTARQVVSDQIAALAESHLKSTLDVSFAAVNLSEARLLQVQSQNELKAAETDLAAAMGLPNERALDVADEPDLGPLPDRVDDLVRNALAARPEIRESRLQESAAQRFTRAEHALYYPSIGVLGTTGLAPAAAEAVPHRYGALGLNVNIPIFNGGLTKAREAEAELKSRAASMNIRELELRIARDVRVAYLGAVTAFERMDLTRQLLDHAQSALDLAQTRYDLGLSSMVELSQAQLNLTSAQIAGATARHEYRARRIGLDYEAGMLP